MYTWEQPHPSHASVTGPTHRFADPGISPSPQHGLLPQHHFGGMSPPSRHGNTARSSVPWLGDFPALLHHSPGYPACSSALILDVSTFHKQARIQAKVNFTHFYTYKILLYLYNLYIIYLGCCLNGELNSDPSQDHYEGQEPWICPNTIMRQVMLNRYLKGKRR